MGGVITGNLKFKDAVYSYKVSENRENKTCSVEILDFTDTSKTLLFRRLLHKTAHCIQCEVCEIDCPTGALSIEKEVKINKSKCIHCHRCITSHDRGCIVADCNRMVKDTDSTLKVYGYKKFGFREEWLDDFMADPENFWTSKTWGDPMYESFKRWGKDALILDSKNELTELGKTLQKIYADNPILAWEIIWINLSYNSYIVHNFCKEIRFSQPYNLTMLKDSLLESNNEAASSTLSNACNAFMDMVSRSPLGEDLLQGVEEGKQRIRKSYEDLSPEAVAYSLYKYGEAHETAEMRVSELYSTDAEDGPYMQFGISKPAFQKALRFLSSESNRVLVAELNMGLEHISLTGNITPVDLLKRFNA